eukprot:7351456-Prorocentrum_lima.AAC.1
MTKLRIFSVRPLVPVTVSERAHAHYPGWNVGDVLGFVTMQPLSSMWTVTRTTRSQPSMTAKSMS